MRLACALVAVMAFLGTTEARAGDWRDGADGHWAAKKDAERDAVPMYVYFRTDWCGVCKQFDAATLDSPEVQKYLAPFAKVRINPDKGRAEKDLAKQYGVRGYPSMWLIVPGKKAVYVPIYTDPSSFLAFMKRNAGTPETVAAVATPAPMAVPIPDGLPRDIQVLMEDQKHKEALALLDDQIELNPKKAPLYLARGLCYRALRKHVDAAENLDTYLRKQPDDVAVRMLLARTYLNLTLLDDAAVELEYLAARNPPGEALWLLGEVRAKLNKPKEAAKAWAAACEAGYQQACK